MYTFFNRHANMSKETMSEVRFFLDLAGDCGKRFGNVANMLFGLYDGYFYYDLLTDGLKLFPKSSHKRFRNFIATVRNYPKTKTDTTVH